MHQLHLVVRHEGRLASEEFVKGRAEGIEVGAVVDPPVHPPGLFWRHIAQRAFQGAGIDDGLVLVRQFAGDAEINQLEQAPFTIPDQVGRIDVLVDHTLSVHFLQRRAQLQRDVEEIIHSQCGLAPGCRACAKHLVEGQTAGIRLDHGPAPAVQLQRKRTHHAGMTAAPGDLIFAFELRQLLKRWDGLIGQLDDERGAIGATGTVD